MARKFRIFVSYSHANTTIRKAVVAALTDPSLPFECRWDAAKQHTAELHREISSNLNWCDVVVPILTTEWLTSHECRDELVRANERRKLIIPFRKSDVTDYGPPTVPFYLRETLWIGWEEAQLERALSELSEKLQTVGTDLWRVDCYRDLREIGDDIQKVKESWQWRSALCQQILGLAKRQLHATLAADVCAFDVSHEHSYLRFAEPIFGAANSIIAICIAAISSFWINPNFGSAAGQYLKHQRDSASSICRLFVFASASEVMQFRTILQNHHLTYGKMTNKSGVFLCSANAYLKLASRWSRSIEAIPNRDFGILSFSGFTQKMYATLDDSEFRYRLYDEQDPAEGTNRVVVELFESFLQLGHGEFASEFGLCRWSPEWNRSDELLAAALEDLFRDRPCPVYHLVLLKAEGERQSLGEFLYALSARLYKERDTLRIKTISVTRRRDIVVTDGRFNAPLRFWDDCDYLLAMQFEDDDALRHYYQHELHSIEREHLYAELNPEIKESFAVLNAVPRSRVERRAQMFSAIERRMTEKGYIRRLDILNEEPLVRIIARLGGGAPSSAVSHTSASG